MINFVVMMSVPWTARELHLDTARGYIYIYISLVRAVPLAQAYELTSPEEHTHEVIQEFHMNCLYPRLAKVL